MAAAEKRQFPAGLQADQARSQCCPRSTLIDWNKCRQDIERLYCELEWPLKEVMKEIRTRYNIKAT